MPRAHQAGFSRRSLAGVESFESVRCHAPCLALLTNGGVQQQQCRMKPFPTMANQYLTTDNTIVTDLQT
ncbi:hypothetical protein TNCV_1802951 [Trichonephila clavipes]|uniref:Uncharacterized protein n=1 Tax=Trichonephila clavipes TaxID=2585209 RepID=A0A8X6SGT9_TRICX|nr:hypothetical protein TNCV_1802951 [Trichonephila clavipes]